MYYTYIINTNCAVTHTVNYKANPVQKATTAQVNMLAHLVGFNINKKIKY